MLINFNYLTFENYWCRLHFLKLLFALLFICAASRMNEEGEESWLSNRDCEITVEHTILARLEAARALAISLYKPGS